MIFGKMSYDFVAMQVYKYFKGYDQEDAGVSGDSIILSTLTPASSLSS